MTTHAHMFDAFLRGDSVSSIAGRYGVDRTVIETGLRTRCRELMPAELRPIIDSVKAALAGGDHV